MNLKKIVYDILEEDYDGETPLRIKNRCDEELKKIKENKEEINYVLAYKICKKANEDGRIILDRVSGSSYIAYYLGITFVNPLEYDIPWQKNITFDLECNEDYLEELKAYANGLLQEYKLEKELKDYNIYLNSAFYAKDLEEWEKATDEKRWYFDITDDMCWDFLNDNNEILSSREKEIVLNNQVDSIDDLAKVILFDRSTISDKEDYIKFLEKELVVSREDLFCFLVNHGINNDIAWEMTLFIGKKLVKDKTKWLEYKKLMESVNISENMIEYLGKVSYLYPKAYGYNRAIIYLWLINFDALYMK